MLMLSLFLACTADVETPDAETVVETIIETETVTETVTQSPKVVATAEMMLLHVDTEAGRACNNENKETLGSALR